MKKSDLIKHMEACHQTAGIDMYQHGLMVNQEYKKIIEQLDGGKVHYDLPP